MKKLRVTIALFCIIASWTENSANAVIEEHVVQDLKQPTPDGSQEEGLASIFGDGNDLPAIDSESVPASAVPGQNLMSPGSDASPNSSKGIFSQGDSFDWHLRVSSSVYFDIDAAIPEPGQPTSARKRWRAENHRRGQIGRNENRLELSFAYKPNQHIEIVGDIEPVFMGQVQSSAFNDQATRQLLAPFHVESDAAYVGIYDLLPGLDLKIGRQIVVWGSADKFSPTNNINPDDLEDRPLFTEAIANQMMVIDAAPWGDRFWAQGIYVPLFFPALLPPSATQGLSDPRSRVPFVDSDDIHAMDRLQSHMDRNPKFFPKVRAVVHEPKRKWENGQFGLRMGSHFAGIDMSVSYYSGFHDIPLPNRVSSAQLHPLREEDHDYWFESIANLIYPRMQVFGADVASQIPVLDHLGVWGEFALFLSRHQYDLHVELPIRLDVSDDGIANPIEVVEGTVVRLRPFLKATGGLDYTIGKHVYVQLQYIRGFIDEFGRHQLGNYLSAGTEISLLGRSLRMRLFSVLSFTGGPNDSNSLVIAPQLIVTPPWGYVNMEVGGFALIGKSRSKFGQSATGSSIASFKITGEF